jgi:hypothetical protein
MGAFSIREPTSKQSGRLFTGESKLLPAMIVSAAKQSSDNGYWSCNDRYSPLNHKYKLHHTKSFRRTVLRREFGYITTHFSFTKDFYKGWSFVGCFTKDGPL